MRSFIFLTLILLSPPALSADLYLQVEERLKAYIEPNPNSKVMKKLRRGEVYRATGRKGRGFFEIEDFDGQIFYVKKNEMRKSGFKQDEMASVKSLRNYGFEAIFSYQNQGSRELQTGTDTIYDVSDFTGSSFFLGGFLNWPLSPVWVGRVRLSLRQTQMEGEASLQGSMGGGGSVFLLTQSFASLGIGLSRNTPWENIYMFGDVEFAKGTAVDLEVTSGTQVDTSDVEKPFFVIFTGGIGTHLEMGEKWLFSPEIKLGTVSTADPFILLMEARVGLGRKF